MNWGRRGLAAGVFALAGGSALAQAGPGASTAWDVSAGLVHRRLVERADDGSRLVTESGPMLRLALAGHLDFAGGGRLRAEAGVAGGELDYEGRTQGGAPLATDTRHRDLDFMLAWRPWAPAQWGEAWLVLRTVQQRRQIASTATVGGLDETATLLMPGVRWSRDFDSGGWRLRPAIELRTSAWHRVDVDYHGVFDTQELHGGRRNELLLALEGSPAASPWAFSLEWTHSRQSASDVETVRRGGFTVGTVRQPRIEIDDLMLRVRRSF